MSGQRCAVVHAREQHSLSERHTDRMLEPWRGTQRQESMEPLDEDELT